jgi:uncharacterized protein DUF5666
VIYQRQLAAGALVLLALTGSALAQASAPALGQHASLAPSGASASSTPTFIGASSSDPRDLLPGSPGIPKGKISLLGGTIRRLDSVRDQMTIRVAGGSDTVVLFDPRTRVFREQVSGTLHDLQPGQRVYIDSILDGKDIFAKNIRILAAQGQGQSSGQIIEHEPGSAEITIRDVLSPEALKVRLDGNSLITHDGRQVSGNELVPGTLVATEFHRDGQGRLLAQQISILAVPGSTFYFTGEVAHLDLSRGLLVIVDPRDQRSYDIHCDPSLLRAHAELHEGLQVSVSATFDGSQYTAKAIAVSPVRR